MMSETMTQQPLEWDVRRNGDEATLIFKGEINERTPLDGLHGSLEGVKKLAIDTYDIQRINSVGVREWVNFLRAYAGKAEITLVRCSPAVVAQLNSVYNFRADAGVKSVAAPYFCAQCDMEQLEVVTLPEEINAPSELVSGEHTCHRCGSTLEFDDLPERYFLFLHGAAMLS